MYEKKYLLRWLFVVTVGALVASLFVYFYLTKSRNCNVLEPPMGIMFAPDKLIDHLNKDGQLQYFYKTGQWYSEKDGLLRWIVGESSGEYIKLTSKQTLLRDKNGTLELDCILKEGGEFGVFYGDYAILVSSKTITLAELNLKGPNLIKNKLDEKPIFTVDYSKPITFSISNGFALGGEIQESDIRVNGKGFTLPQQTKVDNLKFGILYKGEGSIRVGRFRWFRGGV